MKKNMGSADRIIRTVVAIVLIGLFVMGKISGLWAIILGIITAAFLLSSAMGWCPIYAPFKFSTRKGPSGPSSAA
jgi:hypothetical protein